MYFFFLTFLMQLTFYSKWWQISYFTGNYFKISHYTFIQEQVEKFSLRSSCRASCPLPADGGPVPRPLVRPSAGVFRFRWGGPDRVGDLEEHERNLLRRSGETDQIWNTWDHMCSNWPWPSLILMCLHLLCRRMCRENSSGKGTSIRLKRTIGVF